MSETSNQNSDNQRTTCQTKFNRSRHSRNSDRKTSEKDTHEDTDKDSQDIRMIKTLQLVTQQFCYALNSIERTNNCYTVAHLQRQLTSREQVHTRTVDTCHVNAIHTTEVKFTKSLTVD